ncbi:response regulator transcription factor [Eubacteriales bacterium OttesenSCG-928-G02]|nr:response regulator transcription factor [Eubacteriales bacterium OttesenSCG-928-G02]
MLNILLVEDDKIIIKFLTEFLQNEGYSVKNTSGQKQTLDLLETDKFDIILLDVSLEEGNGFSVCSAVKKLYNIPIIFLTASDDEYSVITGLDLGADDYIYKPFRPRELLSRIKNVIRRYEKNSDIISIHNVVIDTTKGLVTKNGKEIFLSPLEYKLLLIFINNKNIIITRDKLLQEIWDTSGEYVNDNTLTVYIKRLRQKIEDDPQNPQIIMTARGFGYRLGE